MPERLAGFGVQHRNLAELLGRENDAARAGNQARAIMVGTHALIGPDFLSRQRIERDDIGLPRRIGAFGIAPTGGRRGADYGIDAAAFRDPEIEIAGLGIISGRRPVGGARGGGTGNAALHRGIMALGHRRLAIGVYAGGPVDLADKRRAGEIFAGGAVQHIIIAVAVGLEQQLARLAFVIGIQQHRHFQRVIIMGVVRRVLEIPFHLAGIGTEGHDAVAVEIIARPLLADPLRFGLAGAVKDQILLGIVGAADPDRHAFGLGSPPTGQRRIALFGDRRPGPEIFAALGVIGLDETVGPVAADDHFAMGDQRRAAGQHIAAIGLHIPDHRAVARIQRQQMTV